MGTAKVAKANDNVVKLFGECFDVVMDDGAVIIKHPKWSLVGIGDNQGEAINSLLAEIQELVPFYVSDSDETLSSDAIELKGFLQRYTA